MSYGGWEGDIRFPVKRITSERMIDVNGADGLGDGVKRDFWSRSFPITDSAGTPSDVESDVEVYLDGVVQGDATLVLTGSLGKINFNTAPTAGKVVTIDYWFARTVGYGQSISIKQSSNIKPVREIGSRLPVELKEGPIDIAVKVQTGYLSRDMLGKGWAPAAQPEFDIDLCPGGIGSGKPYIRVTGKFTTWNATETQDGILIEDSDMVGRVIAVGTQA